MSQEQNQDPRFIDHRAESAPPFIALMLMMAAERGLIPDTDVVILGRTSVEPEDEGFRIKIDVLQLSGPGAPNVDEHDLGVMPFFNEELAESFAKDCAKKLTEEVAARIKNTILSGSAS